MKIVLTKEQAIQHLKSRFDYMFSTVLTDEESIEVQIVDVAEDAVSDDDSSEGWIENKSLTSDCPVHLKDKEAECILYLS